ncbi:MAG: ABC transporter permease [Myxococcales bacterium]|nr:ABC transporter permease [Myxococcales bacterium]
MLRNALLVALREVRRNLLRSFLTILGIVIGVWAVITMVTLGRGATRAVSAQIATLGSNLLLMRPGQRFGPGSANAPNFKLADAAAIRDQIGGLSAVAPAANRVVTAVYAARNWSTVVTGTSNAYFDATGWNLVRGRRFAEGELRAGKAVCIIGETVRSKLFGSESPVGSRIRLKQFSCTVIGLLRAKGQGAMGMDQDDVVVMPLRAVQRRLTGSVDVNTLFVSVGARADIDRVKQQIAALMRTRRHIADKEEDDFRILDTRQIAETMTSTIRIMTLLLGAVAAVSLLVGGIGIMNIMLVSVTERTREIGIRLAVGALGREVLLQFVIEAVVLSALGGAIGIVLATLGSIALASAMHVPYVFDARICALAFFFAAGIGVIFGYFPARRAARLDPIEALRHE